MDRIAQRFVLALLAALALSQCAARPAFARQPGIVAGDYCNDRGGPRERWTADAKAETRARVRAACEALGAAPIVCAYDDAIVWRESFGGEASVRHTLGEGEDGLGPMGLSVVWHRDKWPGDDEDPAFCTPEASLVVAHEIYFRAMERYGADSIVDLQAVYAGRFRCATIDRWADVRWLTTLPWIGAALGSWLPEPELVCGPVPHARADAGICGRMAQRGFNCRTPIRPEDLGRRVPLDQRRAWVEAQVVARQ